MTRNGSNAAILSLDFFKAYHRVSPEFPEEVMRTMNLPETFISWILLLHDEVDTCFLLSFTTKSIPITFGVPEGDPIAMILYVIFIEPLLLRLEEVALSLKGE